MKITIMVQCTKTGDTEQVRTTEIVNIERDAADLVTIYGTEQDELLYYLIVDQELIDQLKKV